MDRDELELCRVLAQRARRGALTPVEFGLYTGAVERLFGQLLTIQNERTARHRARGEIRVRRVIPVEVCWGERSLKAVTLDLGLGGFSSLLDSAPRRGSEVTVRVALAGMELVAAARVAGVAHRGGAVRVSFAFRGLAPEGRSLLQSSLVEDAVAQVAMTVAPQLLRHSRPAPAVADDEPLGRPRRFEEHPTHPRAEARLLYRT